MTAERGCGRRVQGGVYAEVQLSPYGRPIEDFILDPPQIVDPRLGASPRGVQLLEGPEGMTAHVVDWVGSQHYPNVADFVEEVRRMGASRRLPKNLDFNKLGPGSRLLLIHSRAHIHNHRDYYLAVEPFTCPTGKTDGDHIFDHDSAADDPETGEGGELYPNEMCAGLWWRDLDAEGTTDHGSPQPDRLVERQMPSFSYHARLRPDVEPKYRPAFFLSLPISNLAVIKAQDGSHMETLEKVSKSSLTVEEEDE